MRFFDKYSSNTLAGSGNQTWFSAQEKTTGRMFYRVFAGGEYEYGFLLSNITDSSFADGANLICDEWKLHSARCGVCKSIDEAKPDKTLYFGGKTEKNVMPGEFFAADGVMLAAEAGDYICVEITFSGEKIPCHEEIIIPTFVKSGGGFAESKKVPVISMVGCDRAVKGKIAFLGDSITQGIGTEADSYTHWAARIAGKAGTEYSFWDLGIGCARAADAATDGAWLFKARSADFVSVCLGVNDIFGGYTAEEIKSNLNKTLQRLADSGCKTGIFTVPPFDFEGEHRKIWEDVNAYIKTGLAGKVRYVFDTAKVLGENGAEYKAKYGGHPNAEGCEALAECFCAFIKEKFGGFEGCFGKK